MSTAYKLDIPVADLHENIKKKKVGIVSAKWHKDITGPMAEAARKAFLDAGISEDNIFATEVPGAFELPLGCQILMESNNLDGIVAIGCLIKGETPHFHYIAEAVSLTLSQLNLRHTRPVSFGLLTVDTMEQAKDRAGGKYGNKGQEAAEACLQMMSLKEESKKEKI
jgi:6,7-dimethyl-8-ribityllumazine synthase